MKPGRLPRAEIAGALNAAIEAIGDIRATGTEPRRLDAIYQDLLDAREWMGISNEELDILAAAGLA